jgi:hypothetical protein
MEHEIDSHQGWRRAVAIGRNSAEVIRATERRIRRNPKSTHNLAEVASHTTGTKLFASGDADIYTHAASRATDPLGGWCSIDRNRQHGNQHETLASPIFVSHVVAD